MIFAVLILVTGYHPRGWSQGTATFQSMKIGAGARAAAMGGAYVAISDDANAIFWNVAGTARLASAQAAFSYNLWLLGMSRRNLALTLPATWGTFSLGLSYFSAGDIPEVQDFQYRGSYTASDLIFSLGYARPLNAFLQAGVVAKILRGTISSYSTTGWAADAGILAQIRAFRFGVAVRNIGPPVRYVRENNPLPTMVEAGVAFIHPSFSLSCSAGQTRDRDPLLAAGFSFMPLQHFTLMAGYNSRSAYAGGFRIGWKNLAMEYAFTSMKQFQPVHRIGILWHHSRKRTSSVTR